MVDWAQMVGTLGFPIVMCAWFAFRFEGIIENNTKALTQLAIVIDGCPKKG